MKTDESSYRHWLISNNISPLHPSGRWRIRWGDIQIIDGLLRHRVDVGSFRMINPTAEEYNFLSQWRESDERKYKINLITFLKVAFAARREIESGEAIAKEVASLVRLALVAFAEGRDGDGVQANHDAWCKYMIVREASHRPLIYKGVAKQKQVDALMKAREVARIKKIKRSLEYQKTWRDWAANYLKSHPLADMKNVADEIEKLAKNAGHKMANGKIYNSSTIFKVITGLKKTLKNSVSTEK